MPLLIVTSLFLCIQFSHHSAMIVSGLNGWSYSDWIDFRIVFKTCRGSSFLRSSMYVDIASGGSCLGVRFRFRPIPIRAYSIRALLVLVSTRIPASFFESTSMSFGHLTRGTRPLTALMPLRSPFPTRNCIVGAFSGGMMGRRIIVNHNPPRGDCQVAPCLPRPLV